MARCAGTKRDSSRCTTIVPPEQDYCYWHDPARSEERKRNASKGGKTKPNRELADIKTRLSTLADGVLVGEVPPNVGAVVSQILNTVIRAVGVELKVREQQDLIERLEQLEEALSEQSEHRGRRGA